MRGPEDRPLGWVRVMCDYCADGIWHREGHALDPTDLPVSDGIRLRLRAWQDMFESWPDTPAPAYTEAFCVEGLEIARAIKAELPDWTVIYHDPRFYPDRMSGALPTGEEIEAARPMLEYEVEAAPPLA